MSFDALAPHYGWMEKILAGSKLQRCRTAFLPDSSPPRQALLLGPGRGYFLTELLRRHPKVEITCVDASQRMLDFCRARVESAGRNSQACQFIHTDILGWTPPPAQYDLIAAHFFLDCFRPGQLDQIISTIARAAAPRAQWLLSDFCEPASGWKKWRARLVLQTMYLFFQWTTRLPAGRLTPPDPFLTRHGFKLQDRRVYEWGLLHSDLWTA